jgi:hypothetical protein
MFKRVKGRKSPEVPPIRLRLGFSPGFVPEKHLIASSVLVQYVLRQRPHVLAGSNVHQQETVALP